MHRRSYLRWGGVALAATVAGCAGETSDDDGNGNGGDETPTVSDTPDSGDDGTPDQSTNESGETTEASGPQPRGQMAAVSQNPDWLLDSLTLEGSGQTVTDTFEASYFTTFSFEHNGSSNFIAELIHDDSGESLGAVANEIGDVNGCVGIGLPEGDYLLDIDADGAWSFEIGEPFAPEEEWGVPPGSISGEGKDVYGEIEIDSRVTVSGTHDGESNFIVNVWDEMNAQGYPDAVLFNEIGEFEGETSAQLAGLFYIEVNADGAYTIDIE